jgi:hypothetical protein
MIWIQPFAVMVLVLKPLGADQSVGEVDEDAGGHDRAEDVVEAHGTGLSEMVAADRVCGGDQEKHGAGSDEDEIKHGCSRGVRPERQNARSVADRRTDGYRPDIGLVAVFFREGSRRGFIEILWVSRPAARVSRTRRALSRAA